MEDCSDCSSLKKQLEDLKQKHLLDFRTIKQKIISTDTLIRSYQEKCQESDKQKKYVLELTSKLDGAQRSVDVFKLQLKKALEIKEPLKKKCDELEREKALQRGEIEALQDRLKGSENLVGQLQTVIKQGEDSADAMRIDTSLHAAEIEEYKKSVKKNEAQISKLNEQVVKEKKVNKEINKVLTKTQGKVKTLLDEAEESKKMIAELRKQVDTGKNDFNEQPTRTSLEKQLMTVKDETEKYKKIIKELKEEVRKVKQQNTDENKTPEKNKIKSPTTPKWSLRTRKSVTPKRAEASEIDEQSRPLTRLQQKNLVEEIEKATLQNQISCAKINHASQHEFLMTSDSESDEEPKNTLMDKINLMLNVPVCPSLSPLPSSPLLDKSCSSVSGFESNDPDKIFDDVSDNFGCGVLNDNLSRDVQEDISNNDNKDDSVSIGNNENGRDNNDNIGKDDIDGIYHCHSEGDHDNIDSNVSKDYMDIDGIVNTGDPNYSEKTAEVNDVLDRTFDDGRDADSIANDDGNIIKTVDRDNDNSQPNTTSAEKKSLIDENKTTEFESIETNLTGDTPRAQNDMILGTTNKTDGESILHNKNAEQVRGKKRELTTPEYGGTIMTLRSHRKGRKSLNLGVGVGIFSKDTETSELQPSELTTVSGMSLRSRGLSTPTVKACVRVTTGKSLQEGMLAGLEVRPRRRTKRRISRNDDDNDQSLVCSDSSTLENDLDTSKHFLSDSEEELKRQSWKTKKTTGRPPTRPMDEPCKQNMIAKGTDIYEKEMETLVGTPKRSYASSVSELSRQDITINGDAKCNEAEVLTPDNGTSVETAVQDGHQWMATPRTPRTRSMDGLPDPGIATEIKSSEDAKANGEVETNIGTLTQGQGTLKETPRRPRTRSVSESSQQKSVTKAEYNKDTTSNQAELPKTKKSVRTVALNHEASRQCQDPFRRSPEMVESEHVKCNETKISDAENNADNDGSLYKSNDQNQHSSDSELLERNQIENSHEKVATNSLVDCVFAQAGKNIQSSGINVMVSDENMSTAENRNETDFNEVLTCLKSITEVVANENSKPHLNKKMPTDNVTNGIVATKGSTSGKDPRIKMEVSDCLTAVIDSVVNWQDYSKSSALPSELTCEKPPRTKTCNSDVVEKNSESFFMLKDETNLLDDSQVKCEKYHNESIEIKNKDLDSKASSDLKQTRKTTVSSLDSSISLEPVSRTLTGSKFVRRKAHQRKTTVDSLNDSGNRTIDQNGEGESAKIKQNAETSELTCDTNKVTSTVSDVLNENKDHLTINDNQNVLRTRKRKRKTSDSSGGVCANNGKRKGVGEIYTNKSSFDVEGFLNSPDLDSVASTPRTMFRTNRDFCNSKENFLSVKSTKQASTTNSENPTTPDQTSPNLFSPRDSMDSWERQLKQMPASLSPLPSTPKRPGRSTEILSFDLLDDVPPLSPIPPSPRCLLQADEIEDTEVEDHLPRNQQEQEAFEAVSADSTGKKTMKRVDPSITDEKPQGSPQERQTCKKLKTNTDELPSDPLNRYPNVSLPKYINFMFAKLKKKEITTKELVKAFSQRKNVRNHTPIINGLIEVLRITQDDVEHALMERYAEQCRCAMSSDEDTGEPIVSEFEMDVLVALYRLCNYQRLASLMKKLVKSMEIHLCGVFRSGKNEAGFLAICRVYTGVCRLMSEGGFVRVLCYDILKQNQRHTLTERMLLAIACVWPDVFGKGTQPLRILPGAVSISGPPYEPFLATLQVTFMSREMSSELTSQWFQRICGWCDIPRDSNVLEWLARDLVRVLRVTSDVKPEENLYSNATINNLAFETIKSLELISVIMGWKWTNDVLIREIVWPLLKEWKMRKFGKNERTTVDVHCSVSNPVSVEGQSDISKVVDIRQIDNSDLVGTPDEQSCSLNMEAKLSRTVSRVSMKMTISNILRLLGRLGCEGLQKEVMINLDAVINLLCAVVTSPDCETVTQLAAAYALLDIFIADPITISQVLENWRARASKIDKKLTDEFALRLKEARAQAWTKSVQ